MSRVTDKILGQLSETLKEAYVDAADSLNLATPLSAQMSKSTKAELVAGDYVFSVKLAHGGNVANVGVGGMMPDAGSPTRKKGRTRAIYSYARVYVSGQLAESSKNPMGSFVDQLKDETENAFTNARLNWEREIHGDGRGILSEVAAVPGAGVLTLTVQAPYGIVGAGVGTMLHAEDQVIAIVDQATGVEKVRGNAEIIDPANSAITFTAGSLVGAADLTGVVIGDFLVLANSLSAVGTQKATNFGKEDNGLLAVCGTGLFEGIDGSLPANRRWRATVDTTGGAITDLSIATAEATMQAASGQKDKTPLHYTTRGLKFNYLATFEGKVRYDGAKTKLNGDFYASDIGGRTILEGDFCPKGFWFGLDLGKESVETLDVSKMGLLNLTGATLRPIPGFDDYEAILRFAHMIMWKARNRQFVIKGRTDINSITR